MPKIIQLRKKDGTIVPFEAQKLEKSLENALISSRHKNPKLAKKLAEQVADTLEKQLPKGVLIGVKDVQDVILEVLAKNKLDAVTAEDNKGVLGLAVYNLAVSDIQRRGLADTALPSGTFTARRSSLSTLHSPHSTQSFGRIS